MILKYRMYVDEEVNLPLIFIKNLRINHAIDIFNDVKNNFKNSEQQAIRNSEKFGDKLKDNFENINNKKDDLSYIRLSMLSIVGLLIVLFIIKDK